jgi:diacylglycerol kinase family enzyme
MLIMPIRDSSCWVSYDVAKPTESQYEMSTTAVPFDKSSSLFVSWDSVQRLQSAVVYVIISSLSGAGLADTAYKSLLEPLLNVSEVKPIVHRTVSDVSHTEFIRRAEFDPNRENIIVIFSGDTVIYNVLNSLPDNQGLNASTQITLAVVPCGTGNALATSLGIASIPQGISRLFGISSPTPHTKQPLPVLKVTIQEDNIERDIWAAVVCSWGFHASLVAESDTPEMRREHGPNRFGV